MSLLQSAPTSCSNSYRLSSLEIKASKIHVGAICGQAWSLHLRPLLQSHLPPGSSTIFCFSELGVHLLFKFARHTEKYLAFNFFFLREKLNKFQSGPESVTKNSNSGMSHINNCSRRKHFLFIRWANENPSPLSNTLNTKFKCQTKCKRSHISFAN